MGSSQDEFASGSLDDGDLGHTTMSPQGTAGPDFAPFQELVTIDAAFVEELDTLSIPIDDYDRMLSESEPRIVVTDNTVG